MKIQQMQHFCSLNNNTFKNNVFIIVLVQYTCSLMNKAPLRRQNVWLNARNSSTEMHMYILYFYHITERLLAAGNI